MQEHVIMASIGAVLMVLGVLLTTHEGVRHWGLTHGRGKIWVTLLGMERATALTKWFFGPLVVLLGVSLTVMIFIDRTR